MWRCAMPISDSGKTKRTRDGKHSPDWSSILVGTLRGVTPAGVVIIVIAVLGIEGDINRNCEATADLAKGLASVAAVDNELSKPENKAQRDFVNSQLRKIRNGCD